MIAEELEDSSEPIGLAELMQNFRSKDGSMFAKTGILGPFSIYIYPNTNGTSVG